MSYFTATLRNKQWCHAIEALEARASRQYGDSGYKIVYWTKLTISLHS